MSSVGVIGAGLAGLSAAYRLARAGLSVTVYEAEHRVGGVVRSERSGGYLAELGPNSMVAPTPEVATLLTELGLDPARLTADPRARNRYIVRNRRLVPLPTSPAAAVLSPLLSLGGKLRLACEPFVVPADPDADESVADFVRRRFGREALDYLANPLVAGIFAGDPDRLSLRYAFPRLHTLEQRHGSLLRAPMRRDKRPSATVPVRSRDLWSFAEGMQAVPDALARGLGPALHLGSRVRAIGRDGSEWLLRAGSGGYGSIERHDALVHAGTAHGLVNLALDLDVDGSELLTKLKEIPHPPVAVVVLGFRRSDVAHPLDGFGVLVPAAERLDTLGVVFSSTLFSGRAPVEHVLLTVFLGGTRSPEAALADPATMLERVLGDLRLLLGVRGAPTFERRIVWAQAIPQYVVGYGAYLDALTQVERLNPGLVFAGSYRDGVAVGDAIASGLRAAERVIALLGG